MSLTNKEQLKAQVNKLQNELDKLREYASTIPEIEPWQPVGGKYFVGASGKLVTGTSSKDHKEFGTERPHKEQAEKARDAMRVFNRLLAYRDEFDPEYVPKFDGTSTTYFVHFNYRYSKWGYSANAQRPKDPTSVFMSRPVIIELVRKLNTGEVVL